MLRISEFFGIVISMYWDDHGEPHFHAEHAEFGASIAIGTLEVLDGRLPRRQLAKVRAWAALHKAELTVNWELARAKRPLNRIAPLV